jgi:hypothetical protein
MNAPIKALSNTELTAVIVEINQAIYTSKQSTKKVFSLLKNARECLNTSDYEKLKKDIELDVSTINKLEKIFKNSEVMNNLENLPSSWGTLYELALIEPDILIEKIKYGYINKKSTKEDVNGIRKSLKETSKSTDTEKHEESAKSLAPSHEEEPSARAITDSEETEKTAKKAIIQNVDFTFTIKDSAKTHAKEVKDLLNQMKEYFEIPSTLEQLLSSEEA